MTASHALSQLSYGPKLQIRIAPDCWNVKPKRPAAASAIPRHAREKAFFAMQPTSSRAERGCFVLTG